MFLAEPARTQFDLNFRVLGFPVRVSPWFWLVCLFTMGQGAEGPEILIWISSVFVSILIHELGHALMMRRLGRSAHIVLTGFGGLAIEGQVSSWSIGAGSTRSRTPLEQVLISFAGPAAGFLFALTLVGLIELGGGAFRLEADFPIFWRFALPGDNLNLKILLFNLLQINILWGMINLLPILPLDGGQIAQQILVAQDPWGGMAKALWLGVFTGGGMVVLGLSTENTYVAIMFGILAVNNYMSLQQFHGGGGRRW